ncbi:MULTISPECIES: SDR family oxidoreductase [Pseudomonas]|uniref:SDR family oxidoreductase n=1 Tax=Pseudomonas donghuensis TaxID=1163398 RepID=A0AAP0X7M8_9PSED|nr:MULTISPECIES: SDR family oxidoreductase [Pseudomonas]MDF9895291.1 NAD(P)-dependent dehydrogenase (short-subunit alcohol dehydrogenase family) [Pseudomonas vranovensis]KDN97479.1 SDR family oxidoreductase [Pseudomonas donghuensis]MBF4206950.1 SDR family oxidoreductase [Pseudomonas donghuensis]MBS7597750.1 SDR family oxidoreductase [Pseudomonas sp. RC2C2]MCP3752363.1 SDR family oxidoreductase [Pseudomonas sp. SBB6]
MNISLHGKRAIVSGSTAGIGFAIAFGLAEAGAEVVINGRSKARVTRAIEQIQRKLPGARVTGVTADLGTAEGAETLFAKVPDTDILVNNLGIFEPKGFFDITDDDWRRFFEVNVMSAVRLSRHYAPAMAEREWGRVLFLSSESALQIPTEMVHYGTTKTALLAISRGLAETLAGTGVTVNAVLPGPTRSEGVGGFFSQMAEEQGVPAEELEASFIAEHRSSSIIKRLATVEEVASLVVYLASRQASATTGAAMRVDGGVVRSIA